MCKVSAIILRTDLAEAVSIVQCRTTMHPGAGVRVACGMAPELSVRVHVQGVSGSWDMIEPPDIRRHRVEKQGHWLYAQASGAKLLMSVTSIMKQ